MLVKTCATLLGWQLLGYLPSLVTADDAVTAKCNDDNTISVNITYSKNAQILSADYGSCSLGDAGISVSTGTSNSGWQVTLEPSRCNMESKLRTLSYNQTAKFAVGKKDGSIELVMAKFEVDSYCSYTSEYTVTYGYNVVGDSYTFTDSGGLLGIPFVMDSFKSDFSGKQAASQQAGDMVYLGLYINATATEDFDHAANFTASSGKIFVPTKCSINGGTYSYTLFDTEGSAKCTNDVVDLGVVYDGGSNMWKISHLLFLLTDGQGIPSAPVNYTLSCKITVCDMADASKCLAAASCLAKGVKCAAPLKSNTESVCVPDWERLSSVLPVNWKSTVSANNVTEYDTMFKQSEGKFLGNLAQSGSVEDLEHAANLIKHVGLNVSDYLEITHYMNKRNLNVLLQACNDHADGPKKLALLADLGANTDYATPTNDNALLYSARYASAAVVQYIVDQGWNSLDSEDSKGSNAIYLAAFDTTTSDQLEKMKMFHGLGLDSAPRPDGFHFLHNLAWCGHLETLEWALDTLPIVQSKDAPGGRTAPFMISLDEDSERQADKLSMFIDSGFNPNATWKYANYNLLHHFTNFGASAKPIEFLLGMMGRGEVDFGINTKDRYFRTPLKLLSDYNTKMPYGEKHELKTKMELMGATRSFSTPANQSNEFIQNEFEMDADFMTE